MSGTIVDVASKRVLVNFEAIAYIEELQEAEVGKSRITFMSHAREGRPLTLDIEEDVSSFTL